MPGLIQAVASLGISSLLLAQPFVLSFSFSLSVTSLCCHPSVAAPVLCLRQSSLNSSSSSLVIEMAGHKRHASSALQEVRIPKRSHQPPVLSRPCCLRCAKRLVYSEHWKKQCQHHADRRCDYCNDIRKPCRDVIITISCRLRYADYQCL
jgi:hypothetical protein